MPNIHDVTDYVILKANADEQMPLNNLKLQKLLYYIQAWYLAFCGKRFFNGSFQAWVHGPVNREIYDRFKDTKYLYSEITSEDVRDKESVESLSEEERTHIDSVLETYLKFSGAQLETLTHRETPWIKAREGYSTFQNCEKEIDEIIMERYFRNLIDKSE